MNVVSIPTNMPVRRTDEDDEFYKNQDDKFAAIVEAIKEKQEIGQPVLVGTVSIEKSELLSEYLKKAKVKHEVLNARYPRAGGAYRRPGGPARRGHHRHQHGRPRHRHPARRQCRVPHRRRARRDGAGPERDKAEEKIRQEVAEEKERVIAAGGLFVLGTERHESRRIDNQLRGRSGRQGDPGLSRFYLSLDDDLLRIFGPQTMFARLMNKNLADGEAIISPWISKAIETAQKKVEARNYDIRKQVVEYDDVMNDQRKVIYEQRADIMDAETVGDVVEDMRAETVNAIVGEAIPPNTYPEQWDIDAAEGAHRARVRPDSAVRRLGQGGSGRARDVRRAAPGAGRRADRGEAEGDPARDLDPGRKEHPAPVARPSLEGASLDARRAAPGRPPARLRPEEADRRI